MMKRYFRIRCGLGLSGLGLWGFCALRFGGFGGFGFRVQGFRLVNVSLIKGPLTMDIGVLLVQYKSPI